MSLFWLSMKNFFSQNGMSVLFLFIIIGVMGVIVVPNLEQLKERFGFETRTSLKQTIQQQQLVIEQLKQNEEQYKKQQALNDLEQQKITQFVNDNKNTQQIASNIVTEKTKQIRNIKKLKSKSKPVSNQVSEIQISSIWTTYCSFNSDQQCQPPGAHT